MRCRLYSLTCEQCVARVAKLVDAVSNVWTQYDEMSEPDLGAVVMVLEGYGREDITADWGDGEQPMSYPVAPLDEELSAFFKD